MTLDQIKAAAAAIANARGNRRGVPSITNILDVLPQKLRDEVMDDAMVVARALNAGWRPIETAPHDGTAVLGYGRHDRSPTDAQRGVMPGDHWWSIMVWDVWRNPGASWVFAKDGHTVWSMPTHWMPLPEPPS